MNCLTNHHISILKKQQVSSFISHQSLASVRFPHEQMLKLIRVANQAAKQSTCGSAPHCTGFIISGGCSLHHSTYPRAQGGLCVEWRCVAVVLCSAMIKVKSSVWHMPTCVCVCAYHLPRLVAFHLSSPFTSHEIKGSDKERKPQTSELRGIFDSMKFKQKPMKESSPVTFFDCHLRFSWQFKVNWWVGVCVCVWLIYLHLYALDIHIADCMSLARAVRDAAEGT